MKNLRKLRLRRQARDQVFELMDKRENVLIIHYSCESFAGRDAGTSPRITAIGIRYAANAQTHTFSIHSSAEIKGVPVTEISSKYDELERAMLDSYFTFVTEHKGFRWVHWNMRDMQYGFAAIEHRYRVLGGTPTIIPDNQKIDLARCLVAIYGIRYMNHPRMKNLLEANDISMQDFMSGEDEAKAFSEGKYLELHRSTLRKVDNMDNVLERIADGILITRSTKCDIYGQGVLAFLEWFQERPIFPIIGILGGIASIISLIYAIIN